MVKLNHSEIDESLPHNLITISGGVMGQRIVEPSTQWVDFRLNQLGIRVWEDSCQLISKHKSAWVTLGPVVALPLNTPRNRDELLQSWADPIRMTAYQIMQDNPGSELSELLLKRKSLKDVLQVNKILPAGDEERQLV